INAARLMTTNRGLNLEALFRLPSTTSEPQPYSIAVDAIGLQVRTVLAKRHVPTCLSDASWRRGSVFSQSGQWVDTSRAHGGNESCNHRDSDQHQNCSGDRERVRGANTI